jgi:putative flippase GtrA
VIQPVLRSFSQHGSVSGEITRFVWIGAIRTLLTLSFYQLLLLALPYWLAYTFSFSAGIALAALVNARFVFQSSLDKLRFLKFASFYMVSYLIGLTVLKTLVTNIGVAPAYAAFLVIPLMVPFNYVGSRLALGRS